MRNFFGYLAVVIILAIGARTGALYLNASSINNPDGFDYVNIAHSLDDGHGYSFRTDSEDIFFKNYFINNLDDIPLYKPTAHRPPLICWIYAFFFKLGFSILAIQIFQILISTATVVLVYLTVVTLTQSPKLGLIAGILLACHPYSVYLASEIGNEWIFEFLLVFLIWQIIRMLRNQFKKKGIYPTN